jgi:hypothetical protein
METIPNTKTQTIIPGDVVISVTGYGGTTIREGRILSVIEDAPRVISLMDMLKGNPEPMLHAHVIYDNGSEDRDCLIRREKLGICTYINGRHDADFLATTASWRLGKIESDKAATIKADREARGLVNDATNDPAYKSVRFLQFYVTNGTHKAKVFYSLDNRCDGKSCVTIYARDYNDGLGAIFTHGEYVNRTDMNQDYFDKGNVTIYEGHPLYAAARDRAEQNMAKRKAKHG